MKQKSPLAMGVIEAREAVRRALLALPRNIPLGRVAEAAGVSENTLTRFIRTPEKCRIETVTAIGEAVHQMREATP